MPEKEREELVGYISLKFDSNGVGLVFSGPELPVPGKLQPTMTLYFGARRRRVRILAGARTEKEWEPLQFGDEGHEDRHEIDLLDLPEEIRRLVENRQQNGKLRTAIAGPSCATLITGMGRFGGLRFLTYREYRQLTHLGRARLSRITPKRVYGPEPAKPPRQYLGIQSVPWSDSPPPTPCPPLTRALFERLVENCKFRRALDTSIQYGKTGE